LWRKKVIFWRRNNAKIYAKKMSFAVILGDENSFIGLKNFCRNYANSKILAFE
jgi:hypothetical protein